MNTNLSPLAEKLLGILKTVGACNEMKAVELLFEMPKYIDGQPNDEYWQFDANIYLKGREVKNRGEEWTKYEPNVSQSYDSQASSAMIELTKAGLAYSRNGGYNNYTYFSK